MTAPPGTTDWPCAVDTTEPGKEQNVLLAAGELFPQQRKGNASRALRNPCRTVATMRENTRRAPGRTRGSMPRHTSEQGRCNWANRRRSDSVRPPFVRRALASGETRCPGLVRQAPFRNERARTQRDLVPEPRGPTPFLGACARECTSRPSLALKGRRRPLRRRNFTVAHSHNRRTSTRRRRGSGLAPPCPPRARVG
jgi:hypothetical protein